MKSIKPMKSMKPTSKKNANNKEELQTEIKEYKQTIRERREQIKEEIQHYPLHFMTCLHNRDTLIEFSIITKELTTTEYLMKSHGIMNVEKEHVPISFNEIPPYHLSFMSQKQGYDLIRAHFEQFKDSPKNIVCLVSENKIIDYKRVLTQIFGSEGAKTCQLLFMNDFTDIVCEIKHPISLELRKELTYIMRDLMYRYTTTKCSFHSTKEEKVMCALERNQSHIEVFLYMMKKMLRYQIEKDDILQRVREVELSQMDFTKEFILCNTSQSDKMVYEMCLTVMKMNPETKLFENVGKPMLFLVKKNRLPLKFASEENNKDFRPIEKVIEYFKKHIFDKYPNAPLYVPYSDLREEFKSIETLIIKLTPEINIELINRQDERWTFDYCHELYITAKFVNECKGSPCSLHNKYSDEECCFIKSMKHLNALNVIQANFPLVIENQLKWEEEEKLKKKSK